MQNIKIIKAEEANFIRIDANDEFEIPDTDTFTIRAKMVKNANEFFNEIYLFI